MRSRPTTIRTADSITRHTPLKLGLFRAVIEAMVRNPLDVWDQLDPDAEPEAMLISAAGRFLEIVTSPEVVALERAIIAEAPRQPEIAQHFYARGPRRGLAALAQYLRILSECGLIAVTEPEQAAEAFISLLEGELVRRALFLDQKPSSAERTAWAAYVVRLFLASVTTTSTES